MREHENHTYGNRVEYWNVSPGYEEQVLTWIKTMQEDARQTLKVAGEPEKFRIQVSVQWISNPRDRREEKVISDGE